MAEKAVAPHAGSVDRYVMCCLLYCDEVPSLPTRGAWIEIFRIRERVAGAAVAPHAGSVDRNVAPLGTKLPTDASLPTRGAWIEILPAISASLNPQSRSPRGERG